MKSTLLVLAGFLLSLTAFNSAQAIDYKSPIAAAISQQNGISEEQADKMVGSVFTAIQSELSAGREVSVRSFGKFYVKEQQARTARNPKTGQPVSVPARKYPRFKASDSLKQEVNKVEKAEK